MRVIFIHSLFLCLFKLSVTDLQCYKCIWTSGYLFDSCSPTTFNESVVPVESCKYGCMTTATYFSDSMASYTRSCALRQIEPRYTCNEGIESSVKEVVCFCASELCNGLGFGIEALEAFAKSSTADFISESTHETTTHDFTSGSSSRVSTIAFTSSSVNQEATADFTSESPANQVSDAGIGQPTSTSCCNGGCILNRWWSLFIVLLISYMQLL